MASKRHIRIFIIDDDKNLTVTLKNEIEKVFGNHAITAMSYSATEEWDLKNMPDIIVTDHRLDSVVKSIYPEAELILLAGEENAEIAVKALHLGAHDYIVKNDNVLKKVRLSLIQCIKILELRRNMKKQVSLGILTIIVIFLMFGCAIGLHFYMPESF